MFITNKMFLPFFNSEGGASGNTDEKAKIEAGKGNTDNEKDEIAAKIEKDLEESRAKVFASEPGEGVITETKLGEQPAPKPKEVEGVITLNDDFIKGAETNEMFKNLDKTDVSVILNKIKNSQVDAKVLKNYVHGQVKLEEYNRTKDPKVFEDKQPDEGFANISERTEEDYAESLEQLDDKEKEQINQAKLAAIYNELKSDYKDITLDDLTDEDSLNSYVATLMVNKPLTAKKFETAYYAAEKKITKETNEYVDRALNFGDYMRKDAKEIVDKFTAGLKAKGIDLKDLEVDLNEKWITNNIVKKADGKLNTDVISYYRNKIPMLNKTVFLQALQEKFDSRITELTKRSGINEFIEGKRKKDGNPSISNSPAGGRQKIDDAVPDSISTKEFPGFENIDKVLQQNRKKIFESGDSVYPE